MRGERDHDHLTPNPPLLPVPDLLAPVFGFRDWRLGESGLESPRTGTVWRARVLSAACLPRTPEDFVRPAHSPPGRDCACGVHARYWPSDAASKVDFRGVSGIVTVWGHVEAHASGMRSEYARVEALGMYRHWTRRKKADVAAVAERLGVDVVDLDDLGRAAHEYATPLPSTLMPVPVPGAGPADARLRVIVAAG
jgi:hypothetical protein